MRRGLWIWVVALGVGCSSTPKHTLRLHEEVPLNFPEQYMRRVTLPRSTEEIGINPYPTLNEKDVYSAHVEMTASGEAVVIQFDGHGRSQLAEMTTRLRGQYVAVFVDQKLVQAYLVERIITDGQFLLIGTLPNLTPKDLSDSLNELGGRSRDSGDTRLAP